MSPVDVFIYLLHVSLHKYFINKAHSLQKYVHCNLVINTCTTVHCKTISNKKELLVDHKSHPDTVTFYTYHVILQERLPPRGYFPDD